MTLLICTQTVDKHDPVLGFFHRWVEEFAEKYDRVVVVCLREGVHRLPANVEVHALGKGGKFSRARRFFKLVRPLTYDAVFVHMSQEFVLLGGLWWNMKGKPIYLWRNHYQGSLLTDLAAVFCKQVFCTSKFSYTAKYKKTLFMPVGVDTQTFSLTENGARQPRSIFFFGRLTPSKKPELLLEALRTLHARGVEYATTLCGPGEENYLTELATQAEKLGISTQVRIIPAVSHAEAARLYSEHEIYVNCSPPGMYDKTILEASATGCLLLASNKDMIGQVPKECVFRENDAKDLAQKLEHLLTASSAEKERVRAGLKEFVSGHSLTTLVEKLSAVIQ